MATGTSKRVEGKLQQKDLIIVMLGNNGYIYLVAATPEGVEIDLDKRTWRYRVPLGKQMVLETPFGEKRRILAREDHSHRPHLPIAVLERTNLRHLERLVCIVTEYNRSDMVPY